MWDFPGGQDGGNQYLVIGLGAGPGADIAVPPGRDELIAKRPVREAQPSLAGRPVLVTWVTLDSVTVSAALAGAGSFPWPGTGRRWQGWWIAVHNPLG
jgi:hypothetical protein